ncbi:MAG TPA: F0F1 ATP synthase subunit B [Candidatus Saccharimonadales bacterium]|nr:F0F1 ATP synthase subunit B [Candidatus Saccharimonadales bacterium]
MQEILNNFGVNPVLLVAQIVNFLIILWVLKKFAYKPIFDILDARRRKIAEGVKNAEEANKALEKALGEEQRILKNAQSEAQVILSDAQKQAAEMLSEEESHAKVRVEKILKDARLEIDRQTQETEKKLSAYAGRLAVDLLEKSLTGMVDEKTQKEIIEKTAKKIKA